MTAAGQAIRNAAMIATAVFGRFGDTKRPGDIPLGEVKGTHKFKKGPKGQEPETSEGLPDYTFTISPLPANYTFRQWHNYWRQFLRRAFMFHKGSQYISQTRRHDGKKASRKAKRINVAAMKAAGHLRGDNRPWAA